MWNWGIKPHSLLSLLKKGERRYIFLFLNNNFPFTCPFFYLPQLGKTFHFPILKLFLSLNNYLPFSNQSAVFIQNPVEIYSVGLCAQVEGIGK